MKILQFKTTKLLGVTLLMLTLISPLIFVETAFAAVPTIDVTVNPSSFLAYNKFSPGFMLDNEWKDWRDSSASSTLTSDAGFKLVRVFDWKSTSPDPCTYWNEAARTGTFNWASVDPLIKKIFEAGAQPLMALGGAVGYLSTPHVPNGMAINSTTKLPNPESYAAYVVAWVKHYKSLGYPIKYWEIFNEAWYFFFKSWGVPDSTRLSNFVKLFTVVAKRVHEQDASALVGTDSSTFRCFLDYIVKYGDGLGFLSFHKYDSGSLTDPDSSILSSVETRYFETGSSMYGPADARKVWLQSRGVLLPVIISETNLSYLWTNGSEPRMQKLVGAVWTALLLRTCVLQGIAYSIYYTFSSSKYYESQKGTGGYGFGMVNSDDHKPWYPYYVQKMVGSNLSPGDSVVNSSSSSTELRSLAWLHGKQLNVLIILRVNSARYLRLRGLQGTASCLKVDSAVSWLTSRLQTGTVDVSSSIYLNGYTVLLLQINSSSPPPTSSTIFESGFESGNFNLWNGTALTAGETAAVLRNRPYSGNYSAIFTSDGAVGIENSYVYKRVDEDQLYARAYFYISSGLPLLNNNDRFYLIAFMASGQFVAGVGIKLVNGAQEWIVFGRDGSSLVWTGYGTTPMIQLNRWYNLQLSWRNDGTQGKVELYIDGTKMYEIANSDTSAYGNVDTVGFGLVNAVDVQNDMIVFVDNVKISTAFIS
jgi:hypothetical protein